MSEVTGMNDILPSPAIKGAKRHSRTVCVASKLPWPLELRLQKQETETVMMRDESGREKRTEIPVYHKYGETKTIFGTSRPAQGGVPDGYILPPDVRGGYALTPGIPADFWEQWLEQNKLAPYVTGGMVFACHDMASAKSQANEQDELKSGLEPLSRQLDERTGQLKDRRIPKPLNGSVGRLAFDADRSASE
jgi:hypothetical protein